MPRRIQGQTLAIAAAAILGLAAAEAQPRGQPQTPAQESPSSEVHFARLAFGAYGGRFGGRRGEPWLRDWPEADFHFMQGVSRLTLMDATTDSRQVRLGDDSIFEYPAIYAVKVGFMRLNDEEALRMREYLLRGGFLIVDDFHGPDEWVEFAGSMQRVFPSRP
ncbi:MAG: DUF4159 domain-containing protein, partial [Gammaproteobacteria bacterium]